MDNIDQILEELREEKEEIDQKLIDLHYFMSTKEFFRLPVHHIVTINSQYSAMSEYSLMLGKRIDFLERDI